MIRQSLPLGFVLGLMAPNAALAQVDPVARAMASKALALAEAQTIAKTTIVGGNLPDTPAVTDAAGTIGTLPIQVNGNAANGVGYLAFKYGADGKGITNYWVKTRGATPNSYGAVQLGDRVFGDLWQAGTGSQTGHVGGTRVVVDNAAFTAGEVAGRWMLFTGTGIHRGQASSAYPARWGSLNAIVANSYQQVLFPGGANNASTPPPGSNFGGWVVIGAGAAAPGFGALKFVTPGAVLLTTPEAGAFEVDASARPYFTAADGVRRAFVLADTGVPGVQVLAGAGTGASAGIDASGTAGTVTLTAGRGTNGGGDLFTVTYPHRYPAASYPVIAAANAAAVPLVRNAYLTATASGFTVSLPAGSSVIMAADAAYAVTFQAPGR